jgi:ABC-type multidrug transport system ATPase subunit
LLKGVSLKISPGQNVAIVGPSGSGKSTTLKLITRILDPHGGQVLLDGVDVASVSLDSLRRRVAVVPQDTSLFDASVEYNLRYGNASATDDDLRRAVERCNLNETLAKLKDGIHTSVGERGARLSGGERQKVSIARALLKDPTLILCDEVTSSVDAFAERDIVDTLRQVRPPLTPRCMLLYVVTCFLVHARQASEQRTTLTVAHRLSSVTHCDLIVVMDRGRVVEQGTHAELLRRPGGLYVQMWQAQNGEAEAAALAAARLGNCDLADDDDDIGTSSGDGGSGSAVGGSSMGELLGSAGGLNVGLPGGALGRGVGGSSIRSVSTTSFAATFSAPAPAAPPAGSVSEAVASVRRRRVELARGQASATAEEIVDRVLLGSHGHGSLGGHGQGAGLLHMSGPGSGGFTGRFDSRGGGSNSSRIV